MEKLIEKVILVGVSETSGADAEESLHELYELAKTAGAETVGRVIQTREYEHPTTYVGSGKLEEIKELIEATGATGIICDDELTPSQMNNMSKILDTKVMDRTVLILDIFAGRAKTQEGKIQVELAQLRYSLTRLAGYGKSMSRLGGGIGTRGPGETKLESDRRVVKNRISKLKAELKEIVKHRTVTRARRERSNIPVLAIVGYTNAGKSTLLNSLTDSEVLSEDKLFATLDPTTRKYELNSGEEVLLTDTVGFIDKLPHHLIEAFKSTLEEAKYSDIIVHVVDASDPEAYAKMDVVYDTLHSLDVEGRPVITLFNKCDVAGLNHGYKDIRAYKSINISARTGLGIDEFNKAIEDILAERKVEIKRTFPFTEAGKIQLIRKTGKLLIEDYREDGIYVEAYVPRETAGRL
ncbi:GTP-binding protein HflX [Lachnospiraceae bacterium YSD2013]|nr:GTPase HflX [Lachnospiraceae bacterium]SCX07370.1 GTP-binding protein HflX [Lachnospiraceae bacterium YSD2013]